MSTTFDGHTQAETKVASAKPPPAPVPPSAEASPPAAATGWGNSGPLALAAFAVPTFMLSAVNVGMFHTAVEPVIFAVAFMAGGLVQLIAGIIQLRTGNTIAGVLFSMYGSLWLALFAYAQFFAAEVPAAERGHPQGLMLFAYGIFTLWIFAASFRTNLVVVTALVFLAATLFVLGTGQYAGDTALIKAGGYLGFIAGVEAAYLSCAELCQAAYKRWVLPIWPLPLTK
jgi:succinate-acetate transporter protein